MAHTAELVHIGGRLVKIADGPFGEDSQSQTVNVCDSSNVEGVYEQVYRINSPRDFVTAGRLVLKVKQLDQLDSYLTSLGAIREGPRSR